jgi:hypothetical protein
MWVWRRMEKMSWQDNKTNEEVLIAVGEERYMYVAQEMVKRKKNWIGNIVRRNSLLKLVREGRMVYKKWRPRMDMFDDLKKRRKRTERRTNRIENKG